MELEEQQLNNINAYLKINIVKMEPERFIAISNCHVHSCVEQYEIVTSCNENCISQFASNAGGMTSYHYLKLEGVLYILQAWTGDIDEIYNVTDKWINKHRILFENIQ